MTISRRDFLAVAGLLGVGGMATGCGEWFTDEIATGGDAQLDSERVIIVGAGAAGMATAHLLAQRGVDFQMLEAGSTHGGRIKRTNNFVDFPIALGGEWLHVEEATLARIVNDDTVEITQAMAAYDPDDLAGVVEDGVVAYERAGSWPDLKFVGSTWLDFFDEYIVPGIADRMVFDTQILRIEHGGDEVVLTDANNTVWVADRIVFTAPMKVLQDGDIEFEPGLPASHLDALKRADIWTGMKVFIEFTEQFWPVWLTAKRDRGGQHLWYDASHGQDPDAARVLGLFTVGDMSTPYQAVNPGDELRDLVLAELDPLFDGIPSRTYVQHISQNWANEPFVRAAYLADYADSDISQDLGKNIGPRVFMAGCSYTREYDWSSVHTAVRSARDCVDEMYRERSTSSGEEPNRRSTGLTRCAGRPPR